jgi:excisionase family DNA binding protein
MPSESRLLNGRLLSVQELADFLQIQVKTIYQWHHRGVGPTPFRVGGRLRFDPADVAKWLETSKSTSNGRPTENN